MGDRDIELAGKIAVLIGQFPEDWQEYQDWLRAIMAAYAGLLERYPGWQATLIFRWRLLYFAVYVMGGIIFRRLVTEPRNSYQERSWQLSDGEAYRYGLQHMATLLAVAELLRRIPSISQMSWPMDG